MYTEKQVVIPTPTAKKMMFSCCFYKTMRKTIFFAVYKTVFFFIFVLFLFPVHGNEHVTFIVKPLANNADMEYTVLKHYLTGYLVYLIDTMIPGYKAVSQRQYLDYITEKGYTEEDLELHAVYGDIADHFGADFILEGELSRDDAFLVVAFKIHKFSPKEVNFYKKQYKFGLQGDKLPADYNFNEFLSLFYSAPAIDATLPATLVVAPEPGTGCELFIDSESYGNATQQVLLVPGEHRITVVYHHTTGDYTVYDEPCQLNEDATLYISPGVFTHYSITAGSGWECAVYIDDEYAGMTGLELDLVKGREYTLRVEYNRDTNETIRLLEKTILSMKNFVSIEIPAFGSISLGFNSHFTGGIAGLPLLQLPIDLTGLLPDNYRIQMILNDPGGKQQWLLYDKIHFLTPFQSLTLTAGDLNYRKGHFLTLLPVFAQYYNREPGKGLLFLGGITGSAAIALASCILRNIYIRPYDDREYYPELAFLFNFTKILLVSLEITGSGISALLGIWSIADGIAVNNKISNLMSQ